MSNPNLPSLEGKPQKPDLVDDVIDGGLKEMYNMGIDHAIEVVNDNMMPYCDPHSEHLISKLKALKKP